MTGVLIDTHVLLWAAESSRKLGMRARAMVINPSSQIWLSAVSVWEIANKAALGRLRVPHPVSGWLSSNMRQNDIQPLPLTQEHALVAAELPRHHEDPFDRLLIGQAQVEDLRIMTADPQFERYDVRLIDATV